MINLVGQTVRFSSKNKTEAGHNTRSIFISREFSSDGKRYYQVRDENTEETFPVFADLYDQFFLVKRSAIQPKNQKKSIRNTGNADYKMQ
ncbi:MAG: hypothetical protein H0W84_12090 [Bacteroidetes bacterium]|nr:hypothetical protein [Bacteroidota bacterium]